MPILPHRTGENSRHHKDCRRIRHVLLPFGVAQNTISHRPVVNHFQIVVIGLIVIDALTQAVDAQRNYVRLDGMSGAAGRTCGVRKKSINGRVEITGDAERII